MTCSKGRTQPDWVTETSSGQEGDAAQRHHSGCEYTGISYATPLAKVKQDVLTLADARPTEAPLDNALADGHHSWNASSSISLRAFTSVRHLRYASLAARR